MKQINDFGKSIAAKKATTFKELLLSNTKDEKL